MTGAEAERPLDAEELAVWRGFVLWAERVTAAAERDLVAVTGLSASDYRVLLLVDEAGGAMPQRRLQTELGWTATRLSHQLRRMAERGHLVRTASGTGRAVTVEVTGQARELLARARGPHAATVRRLLLDRLSASERQAVQRECEATDRDPDT